IEVTLIATSIEAEAARHIINHLNAMLQIRQAFWDKNAIN
ncbi:MgtC/SapB family protein, partial [Acinetobacter baumannii]